MRLSVIVSTYNQPEWLELVLCGLQVQTHSDFELLVADDGSDVRTRQLLENVRSSTGLNPIHVWHGDRGFRKCQILNSAIALAAGDYIVFLDGDCIPRRDFVERHAMLARTDRFLSGGAIRLTRDVSRRITIDDVVHGRVHSSQWLRSQGVAASRDLLKLNAGRAVVGNLLDVITPTGATFNGGNASAWRNSLLRVNGFDERMGHGGLDRELGERLQNAGVRGKQVRHRCICVHLEHSRGYANPSVKAFNDRLRQQTRTGGVTWTEHGIEKSAARAA